MSFDWDKPISIGDTFENAAFLGADQSFITPRSPDTATSNALQTMTPIDTSGTNDSWSGWLQKTAGAIVGYSIAKDAARNNVSRPSERAPYADSSSSTKPAPSLGGLVPLLLIGGAIFVIAKAVK